MLAERSHVQEGTLARSLLSTALDDADPEAQRITEILDAIPGAWERTQEANAGWCECGVGANAGGRRRVRRRQRRSGGDGAPGAPLLA